MSCETLTGLRIVAALWVVGFHFHFTALPGVAAVNRVLGPLVTQGALGVDLFFVISGFVIAHTHLDRLGPALRPAATARFVWARLCRMWPLYLVVVHVFGLWLVAKLAWGHDGASRSRRCSPSSACGVVAPARGRADVGPRLPRRGVVGRADVVAVRRVVRLPGVPGGRARVPPAAAAARLGAGRSRPSR